MAREQLQGRENRLQHSSTILKTPDAIQGNIDLIMNGTLMNNVYMQIISPESSSQQDLY